MAVEPTPLPPRPPWPAAPRHVHLTAIAGVGMASLAGMLRAAGYRVSGSDHAIYPPMSTVLAALGIPVQEGYRPENLTPPPDLVVIGNAMSRGNPEVEAVLARALPYCSMPEALMRLFMGTRQRAVVVGTHGKTTSSALLAWVLHESGGDPSFMVGGACQNFEHNYRLGGGPWFVTEGDEYDTAFFDKGPKFLHYDPDALLVNAVEFDHADIYRDLAHVQAAFRTLLERTRPGVPIVASADFPELRTVVAAAGRATTWFHVEGGNAATGGTPPRGPLWCATRLRDVGATTTFTVVAPDGRRFDAAAGVPGAMNVANALGVTALAAAMGVPVDESLRALATFRGVRRRQEVLGERDGITLIDDFAHHPTAVRGTLAALRARYPGRRVWALFEPRSNTTRRRVFQEAFADAFAAADRLTVGGVHRQEQLAAAERFSPAELVATLGARGVQAETVDDVDAIAALVAREATRGDVIVLMSNGGFGGLAAKLRRALALH
jgi:UDP-N-acetylmuramate: L-alanyl-gamma-D-glutamyl-meso-diaminopimelate ligase